MTKGETYIIYGLAALGGTMLAAAALSPFSSLVVTSPYLTGTDIYKIRGHELLSLIFKKKSKPVQASGVPVPLQLEFRLFDKKGSLVEDIARAVK